MIELLTTLHAAIAGVLLALEFAGLLPRYRQLPIRDDTLFGLRLFFTRHCRTPRHRISNAGITFPAYVFILLVNPIA